MGCVFRESGRMGQRESWTSIRRWREYPTWGRGCPVGANRHGAPFRSWSPQGCMRGWRAGRSPASWFGHALDAWWGQVLHWDPHRRRRFREVMVSAGLHVGGDGCTTGTRSPLLHDAPWFWYWWFTSGQSRPTRIVSPHPRRWLLFWSLWPWVFRTMYLYHRTDPTCVAFPNRLSSLRT